MLEQRRASLLVCVFHVAKKKDDGVVYSKQICQISSERRQGRKTKKSAVASDFLQVIRKISSLTRVYRYSYLLQGGCFHLVCLFVCVCSRVFVLLIINENFTSCFEV